MNKHRQRIIDHRFQASMVAKAQSSDPREAAIGRQGQALRASCVSSKQASIASSASSDISSLRHIGSPLTRRSTGLTEPDTNEVIQKVLEGVPKWEPGSFGRDPHSKTAPTYGNILGAHSVRRGFPRSAPTERELSSHEANMRMWGGTYWFSAPDLANREPQSFNHLPLEEQKKRIRECNEPQIFLHYPDWNKPKCKGLGRYRMSVDLPRDVILRNLVDRMGNIADCLRVAGDFPLEGFEGIQMDSLLCVKYEKEMRQRLQGPTEETINGTKVIRGFPVPFKQRLKAAETFLKPLTYAAFDYQPYDKVSDHRLAQNHFWVGKDCDQRVPSEMDLVNTYPKPLQDQANIPEPVGFTNVAQPSYVRLPDRRPAMKNSDLEALEKNPILIAKPRPVATAPVAIRARLPAQQRTLDRGPRLTKAKALGKKRETSAVELSENQEEGGSLDAQAVSNPKPRAIMTEGPDTSNNVAASPKDVDSPPAYLLATSSKDNLALLRTLRPAPASSARLPLTAPKRPLATSSNGQSLAAGTLQPSLQSMPRAPSNRRVKPDTAAITISQPATPPINISRSASVEKRNATLSDRSRRRVRWESNLEHTNEQGGFKRHSIYNYSKSSSLGYVHVEPATSHHATSQMSHHPASVIGTAPEERKNHRLIAEMANSFVRNRDRLSSNDDSDELPNFPIAPTHDISATIDGEETTVEDEEGESEELDLPNAPTHDIAASHRAAEMA